MIKLIKENKGKLLVVLFLFLFGILFFNYNIIITWDSSEYLGMADVLGKPEMKSVWLGHRGLTFPLIIKIFLLIGTNGKYSLLMMLYTFYIIMILGLVKIYKIIKDTGFLDNKLNVIYILLIFLLIILNPIIFGYYHTILTEFMSMTIAVITSYLCFKWIDIDLKENKKKIIYAVIFALLSVFLYHIKQSLIPIILVALLITSLLSIMERFTFKNFLVRILTIMFAAIMVILSVIIWNTLMSEAHVAEQTEELRIKDKLICGLTEIKEVYDNENINEINIAGVNISDKDKKEISNVINGTSEYKKFKIYKDAKDNYFVYYTKNNYSFLEQLKFYLKVLFNNPQDVITSYSKNYYRLIFRDKNAPIDKFVENYSIAMRTFSTRSNIKEVNPEYGKYAEPFRVEMITHNNITNFYNEIEIKLIKGITVFTKYNVYILLFLIVILFSIFVIFRKKMDKTNKKILQFIMILYIISYGTLMPYIILYHLVDRYMAPILILTYLADILLIVLILKEIKKIINKKTKISKKYLLN